MLSCLLYFVLSWVEPGHQASLQFPVNWWCARNPLLFFMVSQRETATTMETLSCTHACLASA